MVKDIKYTRDLSVEEKSAVCGPKLEGCQGKASMHVCFEDGGGLYVCRGCFTKQVNSGEWITDAEKILAS